MLADFSDLKPGDKIAVDCGRHGVPDMRIETVTSVSPKGRIRVGEMFFEPYGLERNSNTWNKAHLVRIDDPRVAVAIAETERMGLARQLAGTKWDRLDRATLDRCAAALAEGVQK